MEVNERSVLLTLVAAMNVLESVCPPNDKLVAALDRLFSQLQDDIGLSAVSTNVQYNSSSVITFPGMPQYRIVWSNGKATWTLQHNIGWVDVE